MKKEYIYGASGLVATIEPTAVSANGTRYTTSDYLGSPRLVTNSAAGVVSRHDFKPFGEELGSGIGGRTPAMGYGVADGLRQKFTSKERDNETGLDYFLARYYSSTSGRFTSPDPIFISDKQTYNPQLWNLYNYVGNNPLNATDPTGMKLVRLGQHTDEWIDNRTEEINQQLNDPKSNLRDSQRAALRDELDTISQEKQGNAVAREAIRRLNASGEGTSLRVSDFTLSTDPAHDFMSDRRFVQLAGSRANAQRASNETDRTADMFFIRNYSNQIFINTKGTTGKAFGSGNPYSGSVLSDITVFAATEMEHERNHRDGRTARERSEGAAYAEQSRILWKFGPDAFKDKNYYVGVSLQVIGWEAKHAN